MSQLNYNPSYLSTVDGERYAVIDENGNLMVNIAGTESFILSGTISTGGLTDTELRATPVPVTDAGLQTDALTDTELRATPVPVTDAGLQTDALTDTELRATPVPITNYPLEVSRGNVSGVSAIHKFGAANAGLQTISTDIWELSDSSATQIVWVAPTQARQHVIASTDNDDSDVGGVIAQGPGARTIQIYGLTGWGSVESNEILTMDGITNVSTTNEYVIIHRMKVLRAGTTVGGNVGTITAIAAVDNTTTAVILPGNGQTEMAIYGVPSTQNFYMTSWRCNIDKSSGAVSSANFELRLNDAPDVNLTLFLRKHDISLQSTGSNMFETTFGLPYCFEGPCIIKVTGISSVNDLDSESSFDGYLADN